MEWDIGGGIPPTHTNLARVKVADAEQQRLQLKGCFFLLIVDPPPLRAAAAAAAASAAAAAAATAATTSSSTVRITVSIAATAVSVVALVVVVVIVVIPAAATAAVPITASAAAAVPITASAAAAVPVATTSAVVIGHFQCEAGMPDRMVVELCNTCATPGVAVSPCGFWLIRSVGERLLFGEDDKSMTIVVLLRQSDECS